MPDIEVHLNGKRYKIEQGSSVKALLESLSWPTQNVMVEANGKILQSLDFENIVLKNGDCVETIFYVSGGI